jgi:hypothetical protein
MADTQKEELIKQINDAKTVEGMVAILFKIFKYRGIEIERDKLLDLIFSDKYVDAAPGEGAAMVVDLLNTEGVWMYH